jgi:TP901 family phage tail tape measure protein
VARQSKGITLPIIYKADLKGLKDAEGALGKFGTIAGRVGLAVGAAFAAVVAGGVKMAVDFETEFSKIEGLVGVTGRELDELREAARRLGPQFGKSGQEAAEALFFITSAGLRGSAAVNVLEASLKGAAIGLGDTKVIADLATSAVNAYGEANLDGATAVDVLAEAVRLGKLEPAELAGSMGQVLPIASAMGVSFAEVGAVMAAMSRTGTDAAQASTQLRGIMTAILKPTTQAERALRGMGTSSESLRNSIRERGLLKTLEDLTKQFDGNDAAAASVFGNVRALSGVLDLFGENSAVTIDILEQMTDGVGILDDAFAVTEDTVGFKAARAFETLKSIMMDVGDAVLPIVADALDGLVPLIQDLAEGAREFIETKLAPFIQDLQANPNFQNFMETMGRVIGDLVEPAADVAVSLLDIANAIAPILEGALDTALPLVKDLAKTVGNLAASLAIIFPNLKQGEDAVDDYANSWVKAIPLIGAWVGPDGIAATLARVTGEMRESLEENAQFIIDFWTNIGTVIGKALDEPLESIKGTFATIIEAFANAFRILFGITDKGVNDQEERIKSGGPAISLAATGVMGMMLAGFVEGFIAVGEWFAERPGVITGFFAELPATMLTIGENIIGGLLDGLKSAWTSVASWVKEKVSFIVTSFKSALKITSPSKVFFEIGADIVDGLRLGLDAKAPSVDAAMGRIVPTVPTGGMSSSGGGGAAINIVVNAGMGTNGVEVGREIVAAIKRYERTSGRVFASA